MSTTELSSSTTNPAIAAGATEPKAQAWVNAYIQSIKQQISIYNTPTAQPATLHNNNNTTTHTAPPSAIRYDPLTFKTYPEQISNNNNNNNEGQPQQECFINLSETEVNIFTTIRKIVKHYNLTCTPRVAGGWVRDKILQKSSHDIDIALEGMEGEEFAQYIKLYSEQVAAGVIVDNNNNDNDMVLKDGVPSLTTTQTDSNTIMSDEVTQLPCTPSTNISTTTTTTTTTSTTASPFGPGGLSRITVIKSNPTQSKHLNTATFVLCGLPIDVSNLRTEVYSIDSRIPLMQMGSVRDDVMRRDFTCNALFYNIMTEEIEDICGHSMRDLKTKILSTPLHCFKTFNDDPLRLLRCVRFASRLKFTIEPQIYYAASHFTTHINLIRKVSRERYGIEFKKMFDSFGTVHYSTALLSQWKLRPVLFMLPISKAKEAEAPLANVKGKIKQQEQAIKAAEYDKQMGNPLQSNVTINTSIAQRFPIYSLYDLSIRNIIQSLYPHELVDILANNHKKQQQQQQQLHVYDYQYEFAPYIQDDPIVTSFHPLNREEKIDPILKQNFQNNKHQLYTTFNASTSQGPPLPMLPDAIENNNPYIKSSIQQDDVWSMITNDKNQNIANTSHHPLHNFNLNNQDDGKSLRQRPIYPPQLSYYTTQEDIYLTAICNQSLSTFRLLLETVYKEYFCNSDYYLDLAKFTGNNNNINNHNEQNQICNNNNNNMFFLPFSDSTKLLDKTTYLEQHGSGDQQEVLINVGNGKVVKYKDFVDVYKNKMDNIIQQLVDTQQNTTPMYDQTYDLFHITTKSQLAVEHKKKQEVLDKINNVLQKKLSTLNNNTSTEQQQPQQNQDTMSDDILTQTSSSNNNNNNNNEDFILKTKIDEFPSTKTTSPTYLLLIERRIPDQRDDCQKITNDNTMRYSLPKQQQEEKASLSTLDYIDIQVDTLYNTFTTFVPLNPDLLQSPFDHPEQDNNISSSANTWLTSRGKDMFYKALMTILTTTAIPAHPLSSLFYLTTLMHGAIEPTMFTTNVTPPLPALSAKQTKKDNTNTPANSGVAVEDENQIEEQEQQLTARVETSQTPTDEIFRQALYAAYLYPFYGFNMISTKGRQKSLLYYFLVDTLKLAVSDCEIVEFLIDSALMMIQLTSTYVDLLHKIQYYVKQRNNGNSNVNTSSSSCSSQIAQQLENFFINNNTSEISTTTYKNSSLYMPIQNVHLIELDQVLSHRIMKFLQNIGLLVSRTITFISTQGLATLTYNTTLDLIVLLSYNINVMMNNNTLFKVPQPQHSSSTLKQNQYNTSSSSSSSSNTTTPALTLQHASSEYSTTSNTVPLSNTKSRKLQRQQTRTTRLMNVMKQHPLVVANQQHYHHHQGNNHMSDIVMNQTCASTAECDDDIQRQQQHVSITSPLSSGQNTPHQIVKKPKTNHTTATNVSNNGHALVTLEDNSITNLTLPIVDLQQSQSSSKCNNNNQQHGSIAQLSLLPISPFETTTPSQQQQPTGQLQGRDLFGNNQEQSQTTPFFTPTQDTNTNSITTPAQNNTTSSQLSPSISTSLSGLLSPTITLTNKHNNETYILNQNTSQICSSNNNNANADNNVNKNNNDTRYQKLLPASQQQQLDINNMNSNDHYVELPSLYSLFTPPGLSTTLKFKQQNNTHIDNNNNENLNSTSNTSPLDIQQFTPSFTVDRVLNLDANPLLHCNLTSILLTQKGFEKYYNSLHSIITTQKNVTMYDIVKMVLYKLSNEVAIGFDSIVLDLAPHQTYISQHPESQQIVTKSKTLYNLTALDYTLHQSQCNISTLIWYGVHNGIFTFNTTLLPRFVQFLYASNNYHYSLHGLHNVINKKPLLAGQDAVALSKKYVALFDEKSKLIENNDNNTLIQNNQNGNYLNRYHLIKYINLQGPILGKLIDHLNEIKATYPYLGQDDIRSFVANFLQYNIIAPSHPNLTTEVYTYIHKILDQLQNAVGGNTTNQTKAKK